MFETGLKPNSQILEKTEALQLPFQCLILFCYTWMEQFTHCAYSGLKKISTESDNSGDSGQKTTKQRKIWQQVLRALSY